ncbi:MAG: helix-turn-helix domain-containing protein [Allosphingosinicella sp.]
MKNLPMFAALEDRQLGRLIHGAQVRSYGADSVLFEEGKEPDHLHVLLKGVVELYSALGPRECGILLLSQGDIFMPAASLFNEPYLNSARVLRRARVVMLDVEIVRAEATRSTEFALRLSRALAGQFRMAVRHIIDLKCRSAPQRLASFLLRLVDESSLSASAELPVSKRSLAARVGMTAETLSRTFQTLAEHGLQVRGTRVILHDRERIEAFAGPRLYRDDDEAGLDVYAF